MSRKSRKQTITPEVAAEALVAMLEAPVVEQTEAPVVELDVTDDHVIACDLPTLADVVELSADDAEIEADIAKPNSVVKAKYKVRYAERAREAGLKSKVAKRSCWDWLAQSLAAEVLDGNKLNEGKFRALLDLNGVDHSKWQNRSKGWEGRLRMTGRLALQRVVAECGELKLIDGETLVAPTEWVAKFQN